MFTFRYPRFVSSSLVFSVLAIGATASGQDSPDAFVAKGAFHRALVPSGSIVAATGSLEILQNLYPRIIIPLEVCQEILVGGQSGFAVPEFQAAAWLEKRSTTAVIGTFLHNSLDAGEASVIQIINYLNELPALKLVC